MSAYLGIDVGTSATKAVVYRSDGTILARARVAHRAARAIGTGRVDPGAWIASVVEACGRLGAARRDVSGVGLSVHCPTAVISSQDGEPLADGVTWDHPALPALVAGLESRRDAQQAQATGNRCSAATRMIAAIAWLARHEPAAAQQDAEIGLVGSWLSRWLTGQSALDPTQASYTGASSVIDGASSWSADILELADVPIDRLPRIGRSLEVVGELSSAAARRLDLPRALPVVLGSADTPAASYALGASPDAPPLVIMGTTHVVSNCVAAPDLRTLALQRADVRPGRWLLNGVTNGGDALALGARLLGVGVVDELVARADRVASTTADDPVFIPHVLAERGPLWLSEPVSAILGLTAATDEAQAARGVLEGVLFADRMVLESCVQADLDAVFLSGAFGGDGAMPQLIADVFAREVRLVDEPSLSAVGAAAMAAEVLESAPPAVAASATVEPRADRVEQVEERRARFREAWAAHVGRAEPPSL